MASKKNEKTETSTVNVTERIINGVKLEAIPLPDAVSGAKSKYPFAQMAVGESFEIVGEKQLQNVRNASSKYATNHPEYRFATRAMGEKDGQKVFRVWRVEPKAQSNG